MASLFRVYIYVKFNVSFTSVNHTIDNHVYMSWSRDVQGADVLPP